MCVNCGIDFLFVKIYISQSDANQVMSSKYNRLCASSLKEMLFSLQIGRLFAETF